MCFVRRSVRVCVFACRRCFLSCCGFGLFCPGLLPWKPSSWCRKSRLLVHRWYEYKRLQCVNSSCACAVPRIMFAFPSSIIKWMILDTGQQCQGQQENERPLTWKTGVRVKEAWMYSEQERKWKAYVSSFRPLSVSPQSQRTWAQRSAPSWRRSAAGKERWFWRSRDWKRSWEKLL